MSITIFDDAMVATKFEDGVPKNTQFQENAAWMYHAYDTPKRNSEK